MADELIEMRGAYEARAESYLARLAQRTEERTARTRSYADANRETARTIRERFT